MKASLSAKYNEYPAPGGAVVLLHGLASHPLALNGLKRRMHRLGFEVYAPAYPSMTATVDQILEILQPRLASIPMTIPLYFVTHSFYTL